MSRTDRGQSTPNPMRRFDLLAGADLVGLMERRAAEGKPVVHACAALAVLFALINRADDAGSCYPGLDRLSAEASVPRRTVQKVVDVLEAEGLVRVEQRSTSAGHEKRGSTNVYTIEWNRLGDLGGPSVRGATRAADAHVRTTEHAPPRRMFVDGNTRTGGACSGGAGAPAAREQAHPRRGTGASVAPNRRIRGAPLRKNHSENDPSEPTHADALATERAIAKAIVDAYPPTDNDLPHRDLDAAMTALERCAAADPPITPGELLAATKAFARTRPARPIWCRTWLDEGGYEPFVLDARERASRPVLHRISPASEKAACDADRASVDSLLASLSDEALAALHARVVATTRDPMQRRLLADADPRKSHLLRSLLAQAMATGATA